jgi:WS/DGAT/MGAT family acyltransferase
MQQLSSLDAQFLALESDRHVGHVAGLAILDPSTAPRRRVGCAEVKALLRERLPLLPPLRRRLVSVPFNLDYPYWIEDPDFDLDYHVRELALAPPGSDAQLAAQVARIHERRLDRDRPLWELYVIHGLASGHVAMLTKIHHAVVDGMSGSEILGLLLDLEPHGRRLDPGADGAPDGDGDGDGAPGQLGLLARGLLGPAKYPLRVLRAVPTTIPNVDDAPAVFAGIPGAHTVGAIAGRARSLLRRDLPTVNRGPLRAPRVPFSGRISAHRRFAFGKLPLDRVKEAKNAHGCTVNDVVVSLCAGAVRRWLVEHEALPAEPLVAQIPVSVRTEDEFGTYGNRILLMAAPLFTDEADPVARLHRTHEAMADMKEHHKALPAGLLQDANHFIPPAVFHRAAQVTFRLSTTRAGRPNWNLVISNVPGPQIPLYCAGARLEAHYPVSVITDGMGLNITVMSYLGNLDVGIVADRELMPDVGDLLPWMAAELDVLAPPRPARRGRSRGAGRSRAAAGAS